MASSSVSQESLECDDGLGTNSADLNARRSRIRVMRAKGTLYKNDRDLAGCVDHENDANDHLHEHSPSRTAACRSKDKRIRPSYLHGKGKLAKDKRKLREKRRSTGIVNLPSTESTGDSLDEEGDVSKTQEVQANTEYNLKQSIEEVKHVNNKMSLNTNYRSSSSNCSTSKSPSDDADLEDNQDDSHAHSDFMSDSKVTGEDMPQGTCLRNGYQESSDSQDVKPVSQTFASRPSKFTGGRVQSLAATFSAQPELNSSPRFTHSSATDARTGFGGVRQASDGQRWSPRTFPIKTTNVGDRCAGSDSNSIRKEQSSESPCQQKSYKSSGILQSNLFTQKTSSFASQYRTESYNGSLCAGRRLDAMPEKATEETHMADMEKLQDENERLQKLLAEKDRKIVDLEKKISEMEKESQKTVEVAADLEEQNSTLLRAITKLMSQ